MNKITVPTPQRIPVNRPGKTNHIHRMTITQKRMYYLATRR